jgi:hypothetical protein
MEARKNPDLNPKQQTIGLLKDILRKHPAAWASFTELPKLGANPQSPYSTPLGIYAYPLDGLMEHVGDLDKLNRVFASYSPYIQIFNVDPSANVWTLSNDSLSVDIKQRIIKSQKALGFNTAGFARATTDVELWYKIYKFFDFDPTSEEDDPKVGTQVRKLLRAAGVDGVVDPGYGIIHRNEPNQAVFFNIKQMNHIASVDNMIRHHQRRDQINQLLTNPRLTNFVELSSMITDTYQLAKPSDKKRMLPVLQKVMLDLAQSGATVPSVYVAQLLDSIMPPEFSGPLWAAVEPLYKEYPRTILTRALHRGVRPPQYLEDLIPPQFMAPGMAYPEKFNIGDNQ